MKQEVEWISVNDRLPLEDENYIVCTDEYVLCVEWNKEYKIWTLGDIYECIDVTHWMEMPKAPIK